MFNDLYIYPHPTMSNCERIRLQIAKLGLQLYFSPKDHGGLEGAFNAAIEKRDEVLRLYTLRSELSYKRIFKDDGSIHGIRFSLLKKKNRIMMSLHVPVKGSREKRICERVVNLTNFDDVFYSIVDRLLNELNVVLDPKDKNKIKKVRMHYLNRLHELEQIRLELCGR